MNFQFTIFYTDILLHILETIVYLYVTKSAPTLCISEDCVIDKKDSKNFCQNAAHKMLVSVTRY